MGKIKLIKFDNEAELEKFIIENKSHFTEALDLGEGEFYTQIKLGGYGRLDIIHVNNSCPEVVYISIIELKNEKLKSQDMAQLCRYIKCLEKAGESSGFIFEVSGILLGPKTFPDSTDNCFIFNRVEGVSCVEFSLGVNGFELDVMGDYVPSSGIDNDELLTAIGLSL